MQSVLSNMDSDIKASLVILAAQAIVHTMFSWQIHNFALRWKKNKHFWHLSFSPFHYHSIVRICEAFIKTYFLHWSLIYDTHTTIICTWKIQQNRNLALTISNKNTAEKLTGLHEAKQIKMHRDKEKTKAFEK